VATDDSSRTSAALVKIYLRKFVGLDPGLPAEPSLKEMLQWHDAAFLLAILRSGAHGRLTLLYLAEKKWKRLGPGARLFLLLGQCARQRWKGVRLGQTSRKFSSIARQWLQAHTGNCLAWEPKLNLSAKLIAEY